MTNNDTYSDGELLEKIARDDHAAFSILFRKYYPHVYEAGLLITHSPDLAEEIVQDVFMNIWMSRLRLTEIRDFRSYFFIVARNRAYRTLRKQVVAEASAELDKILWSGDAAEEMDRKEISAIFQKAIDQLPPQQKQVFILSKQFNRKRNDIAAIMNISPETVKKYLALSILNIRAYCMRSGIDFMIALTIGLLP